MAKSSTSWETTSSLSYGVSSLDNEFVFEDLSLGQPYGGSISSRLDFSGLRKLPVTNTVTVQRGTL
jgi:hypothetical protein